MKKCEQALRRLLDRLDSRPETEGGRWNGWEIHRVVGGRNNLLYRATAPGCDLAIKFTIEDWREDIESKFGHYVSLAQQVGASACPGSLP